MADAQKSEVTRTGNFAAAPAELWRLVSDFGGLDKIMDGIESFEAEGEGVGSTRSIAMGGGVVVESLDALDPDAMTLTYSMLETPLPFKDYSATMVVSANGESGSTLSWTGSFEPHGVPAEKAEKLAGNIYSGGIAGYAKALGE